MKIGAVVLAAGKASRFGSPKQLLEINGETLIDRACRTALEAGCHPVLRVLGAHAGEIIKRPHPEDVETFIHSEWETGMGGSLAAGVSRLIEICPDLDALFVLLADQPMTTVALLCEMKTQLRDALVVLCNYSAAKGPPALFHRKHFEELQALRGDRGAKAVAANHKVATVIFKNGAWDIDSPDKWEEFRAMGLIPGQVQSDE